MDLYLQHGYGMDALCQEAAKAVPGATVILGARDFKDEEGLERYCAKLAVRGMRYCLDPQLYLRCLGTKSARCPALGYWPKTANVPLARCVDGILALNERLDSRLLVLPGDYLKRVDIAELDGLRECVAAARGVRTDTYLTVCLSSVFFRTERQFNRLVRFVEQADVSGVYLIPEHVDDDYLTDDPVWLQRLMELCADMKAAGKRVIVGYSSHQLLPVACAGGDGLAAGKSRMTRAFRLDSFKKREEGDLGYACPKPSYYCSQAMSEFSLKYMDLARAQSVLGLMSPDGDVALSSVKMLFTAKSPLSSGFSLRDGYLHYFRSLARQCAEVSAARNYADRKAWQHQVLDDAEKLLRILHKYGVKGLLKDFLRYVDISRSAIQAFDETRGAKMSLMDELYC